MKKFDSYRKNLDVLRRSDQQDLNNEFIISSIICQHWRYRLRAGPGSYSGSLVPVGILMALMGYVVGTPRAVLCAHIMESLA